MHFCQVIPKNQNNLTQRRKGAGKQERNNRIEDRGDRSQERVNRKWEGRGLRTENNRYP